MQRKATLTHVDSAGQAQMVDVSAKPVTSREAVARGEVRLCPEALEAIGAGTVAKGDVLAVARVAGILAAKQTDSLIPLCHSLPLSSVSIDFTVDTEAGWVAIEATARVDARTGVEMEALVAVSLAGLTIIDMVKAIDKRATIEHVRIVRKTGGKSGEFVR